MRVLNFIAVVFAVVNHMHLFYTIGQHMNGQCPVVFEERNDATSFNDYCQRMAFSLPRVIPDRYRRDVCYSKCPNSDTCVHFSQTSMMRLMRFVLYAYVTGCNSQIPESVAISTHTITCPQAYRHGSVFNLMCFVLRFQNLGVKIYSPSKQDFNQN